MTDHRFLWLEKSYRGNKRPTILLLAKMSWWNSAESRQRHSHCAR